MLTVSFENPCIPLQPSLSAPDDTGMQCEADTAVLRRYGFEDVPLDIAQTCPDCTEQQDAPTGCLPPPLYAVVPLDTPAGVWHLTVTSGCGCWTILVNVAFCEAPELGYGKRETLARMPAAISGTTPPPTIMDIFLSAATWNPATHTLSLVLNDPSKPPISVVIPPDAVPPIPNTSAPPFAPASNDVPTQAFGTMTAILATPDGWADIGSGRKVPYYEA